MDRRSILLGGAAAFVASKASPLLAARQNMDPYGTRPAGAAYDDVVDDIIRTLPVTTDYVAIMEAIEALKDNYTFRSPDNEPYSYRWARFANPLIMRMWTDMGYHRESNDCSQWCAVCLGWSLKRSGRDVPADVEDSQSYANWGTSVLTPTRGDIVVFTDDAPKEAGHGHVTIFMSQIDQNHIIGLGGNQDLRVASNCPNVPVSAVNEERMALDTRTRNAQGKITDGWNVKAYIRPPTPVRLPTQEPPPPLAGRAGV